MRWSTVCRAQSHGWRRRQGPEGCGHRLGTHRTRGAQQPHPSVTGCSPTTRTCSANASARSRNLRFCNDLQNPTVEKGA